MITRRRRKEHTGPFLVMTDALATADGYVYSRSGVLMVETAREAYTEARRYARHGKVVRVFGLRPGHEWFTEYHPGSLERHVRDQGT